MSHTRTAQFFLPFLLLTLILSACAAPGQPAAAPPAEPAPAEAPAPSGGNELGGTHTYVLVPEESTARYLADEEFFDGALSKLGIKAGLADVVGSTQKIQGQLTLNFDDLASALGENNFTVDMTTLSTDQNRRDNWIRENGPNFNRSPVTAFTATAISGAPAGYNEGDRVTFDLSGDLTVREITQPVTFAVSAQLSGDTLTGIASTRLLMSDFGIEPPSFANTLTVQDEFGIEVAFTAQEQ